MSAAASLRVGWCPGALRPMPAGDGLIVRVKPRGGRLSVDQCLALAALSERFGNGEMNLTGRANLQIRGVTDVTMSPLGEALTALGLVDGSAEAESVRNVVSSPLAGHDPRALLDIRPIVGALEDRLAREPSLWRLPAKFAWVVDDGGSLPLDDVTADVRLAAIRGPRGIALQIRLGGSADMALCAPEDASKVAVALADAFLALCADHGLEPHRMRDLLDACPGRDIFARAGLFPRLPTGAGGVEREASLPIGFHPWGDQGWIGAAAPFGRLEARTLAAFARAVAAAGGRELRLTPWRSLIVPGLGEAQVQALRSMLDHASDLILDPCDSRLAIAACSGAPSCHRATTPVRADAARLAALLPQKRWEQTAIHISGCAKGCAHAGPAPLTLVGRDGRYDTVPNGCASDQPAQMGLSIEAVAAMVGEIHRKPAC